MMRQLPLQMKMNAEAIFNNFVSGKNMTLVDMLQNLMGQTEHRLLYLWGEQGVGKSHLLQACCHHVQQQGFTSFYLPLNDLQSLTPQILTNLETFDLICIDDVGAVQDHPDWQENLFYLYNRVFNGRSYLIFADQKPAHELSFSLPDLKSRLSWPLTIEILSLTDEDKILALEKHAKERGIILQPEVVEFILHRVARDMKQLFELLDKLDQASLSAQRKITIPFVKQVLGI